MTIRTELAQNQTEKQDADPAVTFSPEISLWKNKVIILQTLSLSALDMIKQVKMKGLVTMQVPNDSWNIAEY